MTTQQTRISIKNLKVAQFASQETLCFEASVYFDGKRVGQVYNEGHGGCDGEHIENAEKWAQMQEFIATLPPHVYDASKFTGDPEAKPVELTTDLEMIVGELVQAKEDEKEAKKMTRNRVSWIAAGETFNGRYDYISTKNHTEAELIAHVKEKHPGATILNSLPLAERVAMMRAGK